MITGRSMSRNSARKLSVTSDSTEPKTPPAIPRSAFAASGRPAARSFRALRTVSSMPAVLVRSLNQSVCCSSSQYRGQRRSEVLDLVPHRPRRDEDERERRRRTPPRTRRAPRARAASRAGRARRPPGRGPSARTAARKIDSRLPSERIASTTSSAKPSRPSSVRAETTTSTRCGGTSGLPTSPGWRGPAAAPRGAGRAA